MRFFLRKSDIFNLTCCLKIFCFQYFSIRIAIVILYCLCQTIFILSDSPAISIWITRRRLIFFLRWISFCVAILQSFSWSYINWLSTICCFSLFFLFFIRVALDILLLIPNLWRLFWWLLLNAVPYIFLTYCIY